MPACCWPAVASSRAGSFITRFAGRCAFRVMARSRARSMADAPEVRFESRMLIDGQLVDGQAGRFVNINPATQDVLGEVADASKADMHRAIDAARRAFDETDWSTDRTFR